MTSSKSSERPRGFCPVYALARIRETSNLLIAMWRHELEEKLLTPALFARCVALCREVTPATVPDWVLEESLETLAGTIFTRRVLIETAWRLTGNVPRLKQKRPVGVWLAQTIDEWVPTQVIAVRPEVGVGQRRLPGALLSLRVLAGTACPRVLQKWWSLRQCRIYAPYFGFSRRGGASSRQPPRYPFAAPEQFVNLRLNVLLEKARSGAEPFFEHTYFSPTLRAWNKLQLKHRFRVDKGFECKFGMPASLPCHFCALGYMSCRAATHKQDYVIGGCAKCGAAAAYFDPERPGACVNCQNKAGTP